MIDIVIPTTDFDVASAMVHIALKNAGMPAQIHIMHDKLRQGFVKTANAGLKLTAHDVLLMNDDVLPITDNWLAKLYSILLECDDAGYVGPSGPCRTAPMCYATEATGEPPQIVDAHPFFCTLVRRQVFDDIGFFDKAFIHYGFDQDHQWQAQELDWKSYWHPGVWVDHKISGWTERHPELDEQRRFWKMRDQLVLDSRWQQ